MILTIVYTRFCMSFRFVYVWDTLHGNLMYKLPGHQGSVNDVDFHPKEPICKEF